MHLGRGCHAAIIRLLVEIVIAFYFAVHCINPILLPLFVYASHLLSGRRRVLLVNIPQVACLEENLLGLDHVVLFL